jgi:hypothetical protein
MMKVGRNEKCFCGSGKIYKKCCLNEDKGLVRDLSNMDFLVKKPNGSDIELLLDDVYEYPTSSFINSKPIKWITKFENLPTDLQRKIKLVLTYKPITISGCFINTLTLSSYIDGVDSVKGWIWTNDETTPHLYKKIKKIGDGLWICVNRSGLLYNDDFMNDVMDNSKTTKFIYDEKNNKKYVKHLWNKFGDIHFDIGLKIKWRDFDELKWMDYYEYEPFKIQNDDDRELLCFRCDMEIFRVDKNWVLNRGLLNDKIFHMVGGGEFLSDIRVEWKDEQTQYQKKLFSMEVQ